jgi:hypothetical protein
MKYFKINSDTTLDDLKSQYRKLAKKNHPDAGGSSAIMQEINIEYKEALQLLKKNEGKKGNSGEVNKIDDYIDELLNTIIDSAPVSPLLKKVLNVAVKLTEESINQKTNYRNKLKGL